MSDYEEWWKTTVEREKDILVTVSAAQMLFAQTGDDVFRRVADAAMGMADKLRDKRHTAERVHSDRLWTRWLKLVADITKREDGR